MVLKTDLRGCHHELTGWLRLQVSIYTEYRMASITQASYCGLETPHLGTAAPMPFSNCYARNLHDSRVSSSTGYWLPGGYT